MTIVAVAGGLGDLGRTIVEELLLRKEHDVFVISRKPSLKSPPKPVPAGFAQILYVDYAESAQIREVLRQYNVDTVISTLNLHWPGAAESQINLIRAAAESGVVKRFVPSEFNIDYHSPEDCMPYPVRTLFLEAEEELKRHPQLTYALVRNGFFMDYLGLPFAVTNLHHLYCLIDLEAGQAVLPGDSNKAVVFTHTQDVAKYLHGLLGLQGKSWPRESAIIGERVALRTLISIAEDVTGRRFTITHDSVDKLRKGQTTELPANKLCYAYFPDGKADLDVIICTMMIGMASGVFDVQGTVLNEMFPHIEPISLRSFLEKCWNKAQEDHTR